MRALRINCRLHLGGLNTLKMMMGVRIAVLIPALAITIISITYYPKPSQALFFDWFSNWGQSDATTNQGEVQSDCLKPGQCEYMNSVDSQMLISCNGKCTCLSSHQVMDKASWEVSWDGKLCNIGQYGPCGPSLDNTMFMGCQDELQCIQGRCRNPASLGSTLNGGPCYDNIDCKNGLVCKLDRFSSFCTVNNLMPYSNNPQQQQQIQG